MKLFLVDDSDHFSVFWSGSFTERRQSVLLELQAHLPNLHIEVHLVEFFGRLGGVWQVR